MNAAEVSLAIERLTDWLRATHDGSCRICGRGNNLVDQHASDCEALPVIGLARLAITPTCGRCGDVASDPLPDRCTDDDCTAVLCSLCASDPMTTACGGRPERNER